MAEGVRRKPRGYPLEVFSPQTIDPKYKCTCCQFVLRSPVQSYCGHRYCQECIATLIRDNNSEPVMCRACEAEATENEHSLIKLDQTYPDNAIKREMARLASKCPNEPCTWTGQFKDYANHEPSCSFKKEECSDCGESVRVMAVHKASECPARKVSCPHCKKTFAARSMIMHDKMCPQMPVKCSYCEKRGLTRGKMREHADPQKGDCTVPRRPCPVGCNELVLMERVNEHLTQGVPAHSIRLYTLLNVPGEQGEQAGAAPSASYNGTLLWRIDNFSNRRHDAISGRVTSFDSPTFYTGMEGQWMSIL